MKYVQFLNVLRHNRLWCAERNTAKTRVPNSIPMKRNTRNNRGPNLSYIQARSIQMHSSETMMHRDNDDDPRVYIIITDAARCPLICSVFTPSACETPNNNASCVLRIINRQSSSARYYTPRACAIECVCGVSVYVCMRVRVHGEIILYIVFTLCVCVHGKVIPYTLYTLCVFNLSKILCVAP